VGSWGVTAQESDYGLDLLAYAVEKNLRVKSFQCFNVAEIMQLLQAHIIDAFSKESEGWEQEYIDYFHNYTYPLNIAYASMLVAECITEYHKEGKFSVFDYETSKQQNIARFIITVGDIEALLTDLRNILSSGHSLYESWENSNAFNEWKEHIQALCGTLSIIASESGDCHA
jgi:hypothetical protein